MVEAPFFGQEVTDEAIFDNSNPSVNYLLKVLVVVLTLQ